jgi:hypothetical protein
MNGRVSKRADISEPGNGVSRVLQFTENHPGVFIPKFIRFERFAGVNSCKWYPVKGILLGWYRGRMPFVPGDEGFFYFDVIKQIGEVVY